MALPTTSACIDVEERQLGRKLPAPLHARLLFDNGGELTCDGEVWQIHPVWDPTDRRTATRSANHIARETAEANQRSGFPHGAIVVGANGSGDLLVVLPESDEIRRWDHESCACDALGRIEWGGNAR